MAIATPDTLAKPTPSPPLGETAIDLDWLSRKIDYRLYQDCIHCGLCTASCPTYLETSDENDGPRGRIYLMRAVTDGRMEAGAKVREHLNLCLDCRACESACPSGVQYGKIVEPFKIAIHKSAPAGERPSLLQRLILHHLFPYSGRIKAALAPARLLQRLGVLDLAEKVGLTRLLPPTLRRLVAMLPRLTRTSGTLPEVLPPIGPKRARVGLFLGCVADAMFPETNAATARVLQQNGCEVVVPREQVCCGAIHYHSGAEEPALDLARRNMKAFDPGQIDAIIVNAAGCGAMFKDYAHLLPPAEHAAASRFVAKVMDISEFLVALGPIAPQHPLPMKVTYHDACHLCHGQQVRSQPRQLLGMIPGLELVPLEESEICCGAAGTYNLTQPEMSERLGRRKMDHIAATGAEMVVTGNVGCILQIGRKIKDRDSSIRVAHPVDLLDRAYRGTKPERNPYLVVRPQVPEGGVRFSSQHLRRCAMTAADRHKFLPLALRVVGLIFIFGIYPLSVLWPSGWAWHSGRSEYLEMIVAIYATLGVFLFLAARNPTHHLSLISFAIWSSVVHGLVMAVQSVVDPVHIHHLYGDVPALFLAAAVLAYLAPEALRFPFARSAE